VGSSDAEKDDAYRAVGRYVVEFSRLVFHMRFQIERQLATDPVVAALALGEAQANQITEAFFAICQHVAELDKGEVEIATRLKKEVRDEIARRNDFAHGDWWIGFGKKEDGSAGDPMLLRVKPGRKKNPHQPKFLSVDQIDAVSDELYALRQQVAEFGDLCLGAWPSSPLVANEEPVRVREIYRLSKENRIVRDGPLSSRGGKITYS
jgi:hypothetical protein